MKNDLKYKIRPLKWDDFFDFCKLQRELNTEMKRNPKLTMGGYKKRITYDYLTSTFSKLYADMITKKATVLVAEVDKHFIGYSAIIIVDGVDIDHIGGLEYAIMKKYRQNGIGTKLINENLKKLPKNCEIICARTHSNNIISKILLKKFGFKSYSYAPRFVKRDKVYLDVEDFYLRIK